MSMNKTVSLADLQLRISYPQTSLNVIKTSTTPHAKVSDRIGEAFSLSDEWLLVGWLSLCKYAYGMWHDECPLCAAHL